MREIDLGPKIMERIDRLAEITETPGSICRTFLSPAMREANEVVGHWMREAGCEVDRDGWGNLIGHLPGPNAKAPTLLLGSHLDTVRNAGKYDGPLGVLVALASLEALQAKGIRLPFHVDVAGFSDEEGCRFHSAYLGSAALGGLIEEKDLEWRDARGVTLREAVRAFQGVDRLTLPAPRYRKEDILGYVEVHIEQGPMLQELNLALGVVDHIAAQTRLTYTFSGCAGHAGTTPMNLRRDALAGAAEFILAVEREGSRVPGLVATVGQAHAHPNVSNVIPDHVRLSVDVRHADNGVVKTVCENLAGEAAALSRKRRLTVTSQVIQTHAGIPSSPGLVEQLDRAVAQQQESVPHLVSGAGHDSVALSRVMPTAMLFVRCRDGLSHHPDEHVEVSDISAACRALTYFLENIA